MSRLAMSLAVVLLACGAASAQDWAKARLEKSPRHGEWVKVKHGKRTVQSFVVYPEVKHKAPAVVVIHEIFGLTDWVRGVADQLAEAGYIAIAPDLLSGMGPKGGGTDELGSGVGKAIRDLPPDQVTADLNAVAHHVAHRDGVARATNACNYRRARRSRDSDNRHGRQGLQGVPRPGDETHLLQIRRRGG